MMQDVAEDVLGATEDGSSSVSGGTHVTLALRWHVKDEHVRNRHVKDAAQDVAEGLSSAAEDGSLKVFIVARVIFQRRNPRTTHACRPSRCPWATREGQAREGRDAGRGGGRVGRRGGRKRKGLHCGARHLPPPPALSLGDT